MKKISFGLAALLLAAVAAFAQGDDEYVRTFRKGYDALVAGKLDEGIAAMLRCGELQPNDSAVAYNLACAYALKQDVAAGCEWFDKAIQWGFGFSQGQNLEWPKTDKDLDFLRADPRFAQSMARLAQQAKTVADYATPIVHVPAALAKAPPVAGLPVLIVLHDNGETKDTTFEQGPWKELAERMGYALLVPSGRVPKVFLPQLAPAKGMAWYGDVADYPRYAKQYDQPLFDALEVLRKQHALDPARTFVVGLGGAVAPAFNAASVNPAKLRGAILCNGLPDLKLSSGNAAQALKRGSQLRFLWPNQPWGAQAKIDPTKYAQAGLGLQSLAKSWNLANGVELFDPAQDHGAQLAGMVERAVRDFESAAKTTSPPAPDSKGAGGDGR